MHPKVVSDRLGHANVSITLDTYTHVLAEIDEVAASAVANEIFGNSSPESDEPENVSGTPGLA